MNHARPDDIPAKKGSLRSYLAGFILAALLTVIAFALASAGKFVSREIALPCIAGLAIAQILVHLRAFLHLDASRSRRPDVLALVFTGLILVLFVGGTIWIMSSLNYRMR